MSEDKDNTLDETGDEMEDENEDGDDQSNDDDEDEEANLQEIPGDEVDEQEGDETDEGDDEIMDDAGSEIDENDFLPDDDDILDESQIAAGSRKEKSPEEYKREFTKNQLEAVLFVAGSALSAEEIAMKLGMSKKVTEELLDSLAMEYLDRSTSLEIAKIADKYILQLKPEFTSSVKSFASGGLIREAVMRTLTIIAAKQPILQSDLSKIRSAAGEHLKEMLDMGLVRAVPKGRSKELTTTDKFADMFGFSRDVAKMKDQIKVYLTASTSKDDE